MGNLMMIASLWLFYLVLCGMGSRCWLACVLFWLLWSNYSFLLLNSRCFDLLDRLNSNISASTLPAMRSSRRPTCQIYSPYFIIIMLILIFLHKSSRVIIIGRRSTAALFAILPIVTFNKPFQIVIWLLLMVFTLLKGRVNTILNAAFCL